MFCGLAKLELTVLLLLTAQLFFVLLFGLLKNKYQTTQCVCLCTQMLYSHCEKNCNFTYFPDVQILWKGTVSS